MESLSASLPMSITESTMWSKEIKKICLENAKPETDVAFKPFITSCHYDKPTCTRIHILNRMSALEMSEDI